MSELAPKRRRGRPRKSEESDAPMPAPIYTPGDEREALTAWWRKRMETMEREHQERIELLRTVGEHPSPVFARQAKMLGGLGMPKDLSAKMLGLSRYTFESHYGTEYDLGAADVIASVAANMIRIGSSITDPANAKVGMDILNRRGGEEWRPPAQKLEVNDERAAPKNVIDSSKLTREQRDELRRMIEYAQNGGEGEPLQSDEAPPE